jgi:3-oxoacyl-[acyl-carrier protein] reductase
MGEVTMNDDPISAPAALVTGGRRGIGRAFARELARRGSRVAITSRDPRAAVVAAALADLAELAPAGTPPPLAIAWDMEQEPTASAASVASALRDAGMSIGVFVHAAHVFSPHRQIFATKPDALAQSLGRNVVAPYALARHIGRSMARARFGRVLFVGSLVASLGGSGQAAYIVEKAALEGMARAFASELGGRGVLVNVIAPGLVDTENVRANVRPDVAQAFASRALSGRLATAEEIALAGMALLDPRQGFVTGQVLRVAGGTDGFPAIAEGDAAEDPE